jgi:hypothetical protein
VVVAFVPVISSPKQILTVLLSSLFSELHWDSNRGQVFGVLAFVSVISSFPDGIIFPPAANNP